MEPEDHLSNYHRHSGWRVHVVTGSRYTPAMRPGTAVLDQAASQRGAPAYETYWVEKEGQCAFCTGSSQEEGRVWATHAQSPLPDGEG